MYREIRDIYAALETIRSVLTDAIMAASTKEMIECTGKAQANTVSAREQLETLLQSRNEDAGAVFGEPKVDMKFVRMASVTLGEAFDDAEKVPLGTDPAGMRLRLIAYKSRIDFATAYLEAALGTQR